MRHRSSRARRRGVSFLGRGFGGAVIAVVAAVGVQVAPTVLEYQTIVKAAKKSANEGSTVAEVRKVFDRQTEIDQISSIQGKDLQVTKEGDKVVVTFAYQREIHLAGPAYLTLKYAGSARGN